MDFSEIIDEIKKAGYVPPATLEGHSTPFMLVPNDLKLVNAEDFLDRPIRRSERHEFRSIKSFIDYINSQKLPGTRIFASQDRLTFIGDIEHPATGVSFPSWHSHIPTLKLRNDPDWDRWNGVNGKMMSQTEFADFIDEMQFTVVSPDSAALIEMVEKMQVTGDKKFASSINRTTGSVELEWRDEVKQTDGKLKLPTTLGICVAPFEAVAPIDMAVALRWRAGNGAFTFGVRLHRPDKILRAAWTKACETIEAETDVPVLNIA